MTQIDLKLPVKIINYKCKSFWLSIFRSWIIPLCYPSAGHPPAAEHHRTWLGEWLSITLNGWAVLSDVLFIQGIPLWPVPNRTLWPRDISRAESFAGVHSCYTHCTVGRINKNQSGSVEFITTSFAALVGQGKHKSKRLSIPLGY